MFGLQLTTIYAFLTELSKIVFLAVSILQNILFFGLVISGILIWIFTYFVPGDEPEKTLQKFHDMIGKFLDKIKDMSKK